MGGASVVTPSADVGGASSVVTPSADVRGASVVNQNVSYSTYLGANTFSV